MVCTAESSATAGFLSYTKPQKPRREKPNTMAKSQRGGRARRAKETGLLPRIAEH